MEATGNGLTCQAGSAREVGPSQSPGLGQGGGKVAMAFVLCGGQNSKVVPITAPGSSVSSSMGRASSQCSMWKERGVMPGIRL